MVGKMSIACTLTCQCSYIALLRVLGVWRLVHWSRLQNRAPEWDLGASASAGNLEQGIVTTFGESSTMGWAD
jgi:hypothetical protein